MSSAEFWKNHVTVSIPFFRCHPFIRQAVESILNQSHEELTLVVVNDGDPRPPWKQLSDIDDPRLIRFDLANNQGKFFADSLVLEATPAPFFLIQDADDWSEPQRIQILLETLKAEDADAVFSAYHLHAPTTERSFPWRTVSLHRLNEPPGQENFYRVNYHGLYRGQTLKELGGFYAGFRMSYDIFLVGLLRLTGKISYVNLPLYNYRVRPDSLSHDHATGLGSETRQKTKTKLDRLYQQVFRFYSLYHSGVIPQKVFRQLTRLLLDQEIPVAQRLQMNEEVTRLRRSFQNRLSEIIPNRSEAQTAGITPRISLGKVDEEKTQESKRNKPQNLPLISCIMPTSHRSHFVTQSLAYFLRQTYPNKELIIVDDTPASLALPVNTDSRIRYYRLNTPLSLGDKRNYAIEQSRGEIILHWDDDDWHHPHRLQIQAEALLKNQAEISGLSSLLFFDIQTGKLWRYTFPSATAKWFAGGSLAYWKYVWEYKPFPSTSRGEDTFFLQKLQHLRFASFNNDKIYIAIIHPGNTSPKSLGSPTWMPWPHDDFFQLVGQDGDFYRKLAL
ncbi:MAG: hypothetical protein Kow0042_16810 [Calditrichia bacterium]